MARRRSRAQTQEAIRAAAAELFRVHGFAGTSVREIAALAGSDAALVIRYFESKELLFLDTMHMPLDEPELDVPLEKLGERFVQVLLDTPDQDRGVYLALVRGSGKDQIAERLRATHEHTFVAPLRARLSGPDADFRARTAGALMGGLLYVAWVVGDDRLVRHDREQLVAYYGALLQQLLTP